MRILLIGFKLSIGIELYADMLYKHLQNANIEIDICGDSNYIKKKQVGISIANGGTAKQMVIDTLNIINLYKFFKVIKKKDYQFIFYTSSHTLNAPTMAIVKIFSKAKIISQLHDPKPHSGTSYASIIKFSQKLQSILSDLIIVAGNSLKNDVISIYNQTEEKIYVLPLGTHREDKSFIEKIERKYFSVLGRIEDYKGIDIFLKSIIEILKDKKNKNIKFILAGKGDLSKYNKLIENIPNENLIIKNELISNEEFDEIIINSFATILPYKDGTQTGTVQISYLNSTPCIVTKVGSIYEMVDNNSTGFIIEPNNVKALENSIVKIYNSTRLNEMEKNSYNYYVDNLKWDNIIKKFIWKLEELSSYKKY